jgi:hypothetical protein
MIVVLLVQTDRWHPCPKTVTPGHSTKLFYSSSYSSNYFFYIAHSLQLITSVFPHSSSLVASCHQLQGFTMDIGNDVARNLSMAADTGLGDFI